MRPSSWSSLIQPYQVASKLQGTSSVSISSVLGLQALEAGPSFLAFCVVIGRDQVQVLMLVCQVLYWAIFTAFVFLP